MIQTVGIGAAILLFAVLIIVFLGIVQRYQLAHLSIERLQKIESILSNVVPETAKKIIEKDPECGPNGRGNSKKCLQVPKIRNADLFPIQVNIGIGSGQVYMGSTKIRGTGRDRWTFTASGSVTILAARLSEFGQGGQISQCLYHNVAYSITSLN